MLHSLPWEDGACVTFLHSRELIKLAARNTDYGPRQERVCRHEALGTKGGGLCVEAPGRDGKDHHFGIGGADTGQSAHGDPLCTGYRDFKYCLLREGTPKSRDAFTVDHLGGFDLKPWDQLSDLPLKEVRVTGELLDETLKSISPQELERAVHMLAVARTIDIYGVENSSTPAGDLLTKLTYLGLNCRMHTDAYLQQISAAHLGAMDAAVAFSHSGCSMDTVKALKQAKKAGAGTIAITSRKDPMLAKYADICLCTGGAELTIYSTAIYSRIPDLAAVDLLYMGIILSDYERFSRNLDKSGAVIADRGYPEEI